VIWGVAVALISIALLLAGGLVALQNTIIIAALPFALLMLLVIVSLYRALNQEHLLQKRKVQRERHAIEQWIRQEQAAQAVSHAERGESERL
jgi:glycine betaine transporter